jgi:hypothetical protein
MRTDLITGSRKWFCAGALRVAVDAESFLPVVIQKPPVLCPGHYNKAAVSHVDGTYNYLQARALVF